MKTIELNGKKYPFIVSADNAEKNGENAIALSNDKQAGISKIISTYTPMFRQGLKDGRLVAYPFFKRLWLNLFNPIPSLKRLKRMIPLEEIAAVVNGEALPKTQIKEEEDGGEKKP